MIWWIDKVSWSSILSYVDVVILVVRKGSLCFLPFFFGHNVSLGPHNGCHKHFKTVCYGWTWIEPRSEANYGASNIYWAMHLTKNYTFTLMLKLACSLWMEIDDFQAYAYTNHLITLSFNFWKMNWYIYKLVQIM